MKRWLRFSLRGLLIATLLIAIPLGWEVNKASGQRRAAAAIARAGGSFTRTPVGGTEWLREFLGEDFFSHIETVTIVEGGQAFEPKLPGASQGPVSPTAITDETIRTLAGLPRLRQLELASAHVTDEGLRAIAQARSLEKLSISCSTMGFGEHAYAPLTDAGLAHLGKLEQLTTLHFNSVNLGREGYAALAKLPALTELTVLSTKSDHTLTDEDLDQLGQLSQLKSATLVVSGSTVTRAGRDRLQAKLPGCQVTITLPWQLNLP